MSHALDNAACVAISTNNYKELAPLMSKIIASVGLCPQVIELQFRIAKDSGDIAAMQLAAKAAACLTMPATHMWKEIAKALEMEGRLDEAIRACTSGNAYSLVATAVKLHRQCIDLLEMHNIPIEANKHREQINTLLPTFKINATFKS